MSSNAWGKVLVGTRLGKRVPAHFVVNWTQFTTRGLRPGDGFTMERGKTAHVAANDIVRTFLKTDADTLLFVDDDCIFPVDIIARFETVPEAAEYDALQAFYVRRGWPPTPIWIQEDALGQTVDRFVDPVLTTEDTAIVGLHCTMVRRRVFEKMLGDEDPETFDWFFYPRHEKASEDGAFSLEARQHGFRLGATTHVRVDHLGDLAVGWDMYHAWMRATGRTMLIERYRSLAADIAAWFGDVDAEYVVARSMNAGTEIAQLWRKRDPQTLDDYVAFYEAASFLYIFDLLRWNCEPLYQRIIQPLSDQRSATALVIGAGLGTEIEALVAHHTNRVVAIEPGSDLHKWLKHRYATMPGVETCTSLHEAMTLCDSYNLVVAVDVLEHLHPDQIDVYLNTISRALREGGQLVMHYATDRHDGFPQHVDHDDIISSWLDNDYVQEGEFTWRRK